ncbi:MAG: hypothetical protein CMI16_14100 [Opitutaceae bacterium]|nr:hypothetical protein [Opitutaceae bacterium]
MTKRIKSTKKRIGTREGCMHACAQWTGGRSVLVAVGAGVGDAVRPAVLANPVVRVVHLVDRALVDVDLVAEGGRAVRTGGGDG